MSIYHKEVFRADGDLYCFIKIQDDYTGTIKRDIRDIHLTGNRYWVNADGQRVDVTEAREAYLRSEELTRTARDWYRKTKF